jgi:ABC-type lipoprotein export system ATPase subunit
MTGAALCLDHCAHAFPQPDGTFKTVLRDMSLRVDPGESVAIIGRSGSGKSTLLTILGLLRPVQTGSYLVDGKDTRDFSETALASLRAETFGFIFQDFLLMARHSVRANIELPLTTSSTDLWRDRRKRVDQLLDRVGLSGSANVRPNRLSGGEQQRVAIARSLVHHPRVVLADEPTGSLDPATGDLVIETLLQAARTEGVTLLVVTHDPQIASRMDRIARIEEGCAVERWPATAEPLP